MEGSYATGKAQRHSQPQATTPKGHSAASATASAWSKTQTFGWREIFMRNRHCVLMGRLRD